MQKIVAATVLAFVLSSAPALACSCMRFESAAAHLSEAEAIFEGRVVETSSVEEGEESPFSEFDRSTRFEVIRIIKGGLSETLTVSHPADVCCICGVAYDVGKTYLVFAHLTENGQLSTNACFAPQYSAEDYEEAFKKSSFE